VGTRRFWCVTLALVNISRLKTLIFSACLQVKLVDAVCISATDHIQQLRSISHSQAASQSERVRKLLLRLHDCASTVGFLSLASAAASYHDAVLSGGPVDLCATGESLAVKLRQAEAEWEAARPATMKTSGSSHGEVQGEANVADPAAGTGPEGSASAAHCATVVRRYLAERP
jgi:hypothetical protein